VRDQIMVSGALGESRRVQEEPVKTRLLITTWWSLDCRQATSQCSWVIGVSSSVSLHVIRYNL